MQKFDVFVIGSGMSGMTIATRCASKGLTVGITDELPYGGTCALRGCDPKRVLIGVTEAAEMASKFAGKGLKADITPKWADAMFFKRSFTDPVPSGIEERYKNNGIAMFHSSAEFISKNQLRLGDEIIQAGKIAIATGARPRQLNIPGQEYALTSTDFLTMKRLPESILFIGGGYIAFEFAHLAARFGSKVTIVHKDKYPLKKFDPDIVKHLISATEALGIDIVLETEVTSIKKQQDSFSVAGKSNENIIRLTAQAVFNSSGRVPAIHGLNLQAGNVAAQDEGIVVNKYLQSTSNPDVYASGDVAASKQLPLTPIAVMDGHVVSSNIIKGNNKSPENDAIPTVVFSQPAMASVGLTEEQASEENIPVKVNFKSVPNWFNAKRVSAKQYTYKTLVHKETDKLLGAHLIGPGAEETINIFAIAIKVGMTAADIRKTVFSYPTWGSDISYMV